MHHTWEYQHVSWEEREIKIEMSLLSRGEIPQHLISFPPLPWLAEEDSVDHSNFPRVFTLLSEPLFYLFLNFIFLFSLQLVIFFSLKNLAEITWTEEFCVPPAITTSTYLHSEVTWGVSIEDVEDLQTLNVQWTVLSFTENEIHNFAAFGILSISHLYLLKLPSDSQHWEHSHPVRDHEEDTLWRCLRGGFDLGITPTLLLGSRTSRVHDAPKPHSPSCRLHTQPSKEGLSFFFSLQVNSSAICREFSLHGQQHLAQGLVGLWV